MPNWCTNTLFFGTREAYDFLNKKYLGMTENRGLLSAILPRPAEISDGWYEWSLTYWGTKWDVPDARWLPDELCVCFSTAWNPPIPAIAVLLGQLPAGEHRLELTFADPDMAIVGHWSASVQARQYAPDDPAYRRTLLDELGYRADWVDAQDG